ncbi:acyl carrier protein [Streptomyces niveus]|uniref:acyl carrier protein n=1 Tax=Streptomyces niveus TaxID=193462 RepID=UPI0036C02345
MPGDNEAEVQQPVGGSVDEVNPRRRAAAGAADGAGEDVPDLLLELTNELLERGDITLDEDFFATGGDSIVAMHLVGQLARRTGLRLRVSLLFANPVLRDFAEHVERLRGEAAANDAEPVSPLAAALEAARTADRSAARAS